MHPFRRAAASLMICASVLGPAVSTRAEEFDPSRILSDAEIRRSDAMSLSDIRAFVNAKGGFDAVTDVDPVDGRRKSGALLVRDASVRYGINPKYVLALLQKESSIIETQVPTKRQKDWAAGYALCDGCRVTAPLARKYQGLAKQIDAGAGWMDWYLKNAASSDVLRQAGKATVISGTTVVPANAVTAALYSYTPHMHGNQLLWNIMRRWFGVGGEALTFPDGTLVRNAANGAVALIQGGRFRPIIKASLITTRFKTANVVDLNSFDFAALDHGSRGTAVRFSDYSLVRTETGTTYLIDGTTKRRISSPAAFAAIGFNPEEVEDASEADLTDYADGPVLDATDDHALGELLQDASTGGIWYAVSGQKHALLDRVLLDSNFAGRPVRKADGAEIAALSDAGPVLIADGTLVMTAGNPSVYLISGGKKRPFATQDDFLGLGFSFSRVHSISTQLLALHPSGQAISIPGTRQLFP